MHPLGELDADSCLALAAALENRSEHPIARAFGRAPLAAESVETVPGLGLQGSVQGRNLRIGQPGFVAEGFAGSAPAIHGEHGQWLLLGDEHGPLAAGTRRPATRRRPGSAGSLPPTRLADTAAFGDSSPMVAQIASDTGIDRAEGGMTPAAKLAGLQALQAEGHRVLMLGDGVNDVPVLAAADISVAMGSATDLAKTSADAVLLSNRLGSLAQAFDIARRSRRIIIENLAWASLYNGLILPFAAVGWVTPLWAALGMSISSLLVVLNALRLTRQPDPAGRG